MQKENTYKDSLFSILWNTPDPIITFFYLFIVHPVRSLPKQHTAAKSLISTMLRLQDVKSNMFLLNKENIDIIEQV